ncbi:MAG: Hpt domain-containing protein [Azoarcus sp.]|jgi:chemosensory pili system protein ChpA (sensor histidine kinase/response regulator)|nr:Hpt domain-containing protein [Azoarcus sp.]
MTQANEPDIGPLTWVKSEIEQALSHAAESLQAAVGADDGTAKVQFAQTHLHQASGALSIIGLDGLTKFVAALDLFLGSLARGELPTTEAQVTLARRALASIANYLEELIHGTPDQPLRLLPLYRELVVARGEPAPPPADLFFPDLSVRIPQREGAQKFDAQQRLQERRNMRLRFQRGLLDWLRQPGTSSIDAMRTALVGLETTEDNLGMRSLWWAGQALIDTLADTPPDVLPTAKYLLSRIETQLRHAGDGPQALPERLLREMLYHVACRPATTPTQKAVHQAWQLDTLIPEEGALVSDLPLAPLLKGLHAQLAEIKNEWNAFGERGISSLPKFRAQIEEFTKSTVQLARPVLYRLLGGMCRFVAWLNANPQRYSEPIALEFATALLLSEAALDRAVPGIGFQNQVGEALSRLEALARGEEPSGAPPSAASVESARKQQEKEALAQVSHEILSSLATIEQTLDDFFRDHTKRAPLQTLDAPLHQIEGALSLLGEDDAIVLVKEAAEIIARLANDNTPANESELTELARRFSALGFFIQSLQYSRTPVSQIMTSGMASRMPKAAETTLPELSETPAATVSATPVGRASVTPPDGIETFPSFAIDVEGQPESIAASLPPAPTAAQTQSRIPAPPPVSPAQQAELDAELLDIFIEEAREVLGTAAQHLKLLRASPDSRDNLTEIRRGFHTLKGSGRMVGLSELGEAAWGMEQTLNRWLQLEWPVNPELLQLLGDAHQEFLAWVDQIEHQSEYGRDVATLLAEADRLRNSGMATAGEASKTPVSAPEPKPEPKPEAQPQAIPELEAMPDVEEVPDEIEVTPDAEAVPEIEQTPDTSNQPDEPFAPIEAQPVEQPFELENFDLDVIPLDEQDEIQPVTPLPDDAQAPPAETSTDSPGAKKHKHPSGKSSSKPTRSAVPKFEPFDFSPFTFDASDIDIPDLEITDALEEIPAEEAPPHEPDDIQPEAAVSEEQPADTDIDISSQEITVSLTPDTVSAVPDTASNLSGTESDLPNFVPEDSLPPEAQPGTYPDPDSETLHIGDVELSRSLFELYVAEAQMHIATLHQEFDHLAENPTLLLPESALRAAHSCAGISGTARCTPLYHLGKALELAQERIRGQNRPPTPNELALFKTCANTLESMLTIIIGLHMPLETPELIGQLDRICHEPEADALKSPDDKAIAEAVAKTFPSAAAVPAKASETAPKPSSSQTSDLPAVDDELDEQLLPIFLEEAEELVNGLHAALRAWGESPTSADRAMLVKRQLHTLKGSARMAGAMVLGNRVHQLESRVERALDSGSDIPAFIEETASALDGIEQMVAVLGGAPAPEKTSTALPAAASKQPPARPAAIQTPEQKDAARLKPTAGASLHKSKHPTVPAEAPAAEGGAVTALRVRAEMVDNFVNDTSEIGVTRTRIEGELRQLRHSLLDLTENVIRLRNQLREVEIQADVQMQTRMAQAESRHTEFDPLEMDRYTRLQELTRMMAESVNDVTTVQQNLLKNLDNADFAIHSQARTTRELQQALMRVRMVPFESLAVRLYRIVRRGAKDLGKRANLDIRGGGIEIDRSVLDHIIAPLEHMLRNSLAHGIETPEVRRTKGKPEIGQITLTARQESNEVVIELADDGAGLNFERIIGRARERGLLGKDETADERRLANLIFVPGFSTAEKVTAVSGRGVGMDVVKSDTAAVGGRVDISTTPGKGTTFSIFLPLTLAVTQALLVRSGNQHYAIPSSMVSQIMELKEADIKRLRKEGSIEWMGRQYAYRYLPNLLGNLNVKPEIGRYSWVLLLHSGSQTLALHVDALFGHQEIIVKNAGPQLTRIVGMSGATVLGNGEIVLIINPIAMMSREIIYNQIGRPTTSTLPPCGEALPEAVHLPTVMVVDDSLTVRRITTRMLEREGYRVITAKDGVDAIESLIDNLPDVILSDIEMPRMDGFDLVRNIRADARLRNVPIIMITSRLADKHRDYAMEIGANHYLGKPYQEDELLGLIAGYTNRA